MCNVESKARSDGRWARLSRFGLDACPYPFGDDLAFAWVAGWSEEDKECSDSVRALEKEAVRLGKVRRL